MSTPPEATDQQTAGAFDIRNIIGIVLGIFGVILVVMGLFFSPQSELDKSGGLRANLIAGIVMVLAAVVFIGWSRLRPIVVSAAPEPGNT
jgi:drug/metabolite transporter (DMT)-like permease